MLLFFFFPFVGLHLIFKCWWTILTVCSTFRRSENTQKHELQNKTKRVTYYVMVRLKIVSNHSYNRTDLIYFHMPPLQQQRRLCFIHCSLLPSTGCCCSCNVLLQVQLEWKQQNNKNIQLPCLLGGIFRRFLGQILCYNIKVILKIVNGKMKTISIDMAFVELKKKKIKKWIKWKRIICSD